MNHNPNIRTFPDTASWLADRSGWIGASESPAVLGANPYRSAFGVYANKCEQHEEEETSRMRAGLFFEDAIARYWANEHGFSVQTPAERVGAAPGARVVFKAPNVPIACTPDFFVSDGAQEFVLECKRVAPAAAIKWKDGPPLYYVMQVQHQLGVLRECDAEFEHIACGLLVVDFGGDDVRDYEVRYDPELWDLVRRGCVKFWTEHVLARTPPPVDPLTSPEEVSRVFRRATISNSIEVPAQLVAQYAALKEQEKAVGMAVGQAKAALEAAIGNHEGATVSGALVATWKNKAVNQPAREASVSHQRPLLLTSAGRSLQP